MSVAREVGDTGRARHGRKAGQRGHSGSGTGCGWHGWLRHGRDVGGTGGGGTHLGLAVHLPTLRLPSLVEVGVLRQPTLLRRLRVSA